MFGKIKQQARSWGLHVLLMDMGQTASYPLYSAVSVQRWNVPNFQNEILFSTSSSSFLDSCDSCPASFNTEQSAVSSWTWRKPLAPDPSGSGVPMSLPWCPHVHWAVSTCPSCGVPVSLLWGRGCSGASLLCLRPEILAACKGLLRSVGSVWTQNWTQVTTANRLERWGISRMN